SGLFWYRYSHACVRGLCSPCTHCMNDGSSSILSKSIGLFCFISLYTSGLSLVRPTPLLIFSTMTKSLRTKTHQSHVYRDHSMNLVTQDFEFFLIFFQ